MAEGDIWVDHERIGRQKSLAVVPFVGTHALKKQKTR
jgi:hypothetical protein